MDKFSTWERIIIALFVALIIWAFWSDVTYAATTKSSNRIHYLERQVEEAKKSGWAAGYSQGVKYREEATKQSCLLLSGD